MIDKCNFKNKVEDGYQCVLAMRMHHQDSLEQGGIQTAVQCVGEENCVLFQQYKLLNDIFSKLCLMYNKNVCDDSFDFDFDDPGTFKKWYGNTTGDVE